MGAAKDLRERGLLRQVMGETAVWTEKYRPQTFDDVSGQDEIVKRVRSFVEQGNMPHLLFSGPAGTGKTSLAIVIARHLFGNDWHGNMLELNASDDRGIGVIRETVKNFARTRALGDVPFKIIYLDECDALTKDAQHALRRTMENNTRTCRFILSCNYSSKIIDPIQSRCAIFRFKPLADEALKGILDKVTQQESLTLEPVAEKAIIEVSGGDVRRLHNLLQSSAAVSNKITEQLVFELASVARPKEIAEVLTLALGGKFPEARKRLTSIMLSYGFSGLDAVKQIQQQALALDSSVLGDRDKLKLIERCGEHEFRLVEGADEYVQLEALLAFVTLLGSEKQGSH